MATKNRAAATAFILKYIDKLMPGSPNKEIYEKRFAAMSDSQFDDFMAQLKDKKIQLTVIAPNLSKQRLSVARNFEIADELGHDFYKRLWLTNPDTGLQYLSPKKYLIIHLPLRRQAQLLIKKVSIPEDSKSVDDFTGQPTGKSKGSKISFPEAQVLAALGLDNSLVEMMKYRGGDQKGFIAMNNSINRTGGVSLNALDALNTEVTSTSTLRTLLTGMHLSNTL